MVESCVFCNPSDFKERKLSYEDEKGYWYLVVPKEVGVFAQILLVVRKRNTDTRHITDISDPQFLQDDDRLLSVMKGISVVSGKLKAGLEDPKGRRIEKVYVLTQCEGIETHLHFQLFPRYDGDHEQNEFLYECELEEARWQDPPKRPPSSRINEGTKILEKYNSLLSKNEFLHSEQFKSVSINRIVRKLNEVLG
jgi:diadenosine tetraphosphate (Ap4A) HIT family hydrolase